MREYFASISSGQVKRADMAITVTKIIARMMIMMIVVIIGCITLGTLADAQTVTIQPEQVVQNASFHSTSQTVNYKCLFNHELLIISRKRINNSAYIQSFIKKLEDTDVDAIMCCPTAWRANLFPSEVDPTWKRYRSYQPLSKFPSWDYIMRYLHKGGDPVKDTLEACRKCGKDFFISYRMNDHHYVDDLEWPTHNDFWRDHREYWLGNTNNSPYTRKDNVRLFNYMLPQVRNYYFDIIKELCTNYDVDGVELDFQRFPKFFPKTYLKQGSVVMTAFVKRIREFLDQLGEKRNKSLRLCVRVPENIAKCRKAGLDVSGWDKEQLIDMINISSCYFHTIELGLEEFKAATTHAKIYGEMNYVTAQRKPQGAKRALARCYTTLPIYYASAMNFFSRGANGISLFNFDYVPERFRIPMAKGLKGITDFEHLKTLPKDYVLTRNFGSFPARNKATVHMIIPDNTQEVTFEKAVLRIETKKSCEEMKINVQMNGKSLSSCTPKETELFPGLSSNIAYAGAERLKFYTVPLDTVIAGKNEIKISNPESENATCVLYGMEIALYR